MKQSLSQALYEKACEHVNFRAVLNLAVFSVLNIEKQKYNKSILLEWEIQVETPYPS